MYLFFDTETTGKPSNYKAPFTDLSNWPRIVQIAWILTDENGNLIETSEFIIKPSGFEIPLDAVRIHNITTERALIEGHPLDDVLDQFAKVLEKSKVMIAHNVNFDKPIVMAEFLRMEIPNTMKSIPEICTMISSTNYCELHPIRYGQYKWPTLPELHFKLFNSNFNDSHNALEDVRACMRCFFELKKRGVIAAPELAAN